MSTYERRLSWLRTFRGYSEDEAELAAWAADEIERLRAALERIKRESGNPGFVPSAIAREALAARG